jgi:hypothetical protein
LAEEGEEPTPKFQVYDGKPVMLEELSVNSTLEPTQTDVLLAEKSAVCPHPLAEINKKRPAKRNILVSLNSIRLLFIERETDLILKIISEISRPIFKSIQQWETNVKN